jgi:DNA-binding MarR family transcriptional regulator
MMPNSKKSSDLKKYSVGFRLTKIICLKRRYIDREMKPFGVTRMQWQTLHWLNSVNPCTQKELLSHMDIDAAQLARILDDFEKNNLITRAPLPDDRRCLLVTLTPHAKKQLIPQLEKALATENDILLDGIHFADQKKLMQLLETIENNIESVLNAE